MWMIMNDATEFEEIFRGLARGCTDGLVKSAGVDNAINIGP